MCICMDMINDEISTNNHCTQSLNHEHANNLQIIQILLSFYVSQYCMLYIIQCVICWPLVGRWKLQSWWWEQCWSQTTSAERWSRRPRLTQSDLINTENSIWVRLTNSGVVVHRQWFSFCFCPLKAPYAYHYTKHVHLRVAGFLHYIPTYDNTTQQYFDHLCRTCMLLTFDFLDSHFPGNENNHNVVKQTRKFFQQLQEEKIRHTHINTGQQSSSFDLHLKLGLLNSRVFSMALQNALSTIKITVLIISSLL